MFAQGLTTRRDFNDAVGLPIALSIGSDRYGRRFCAAGRPTAPAAYVRGAVAFSHHVTVA
jgi:hypothetical protein